MPPKITASSPTVSVATNEPILPSSSPLSSPASISNPRTNPSTPPTKPTPPPSIINLSSTSPTPAPELPIIPGYLIREISDLSDPDVIAELDKIYSSGKWPSSNMAFPNSSESLLCLTVFGPQSIISAYKQENTILRIYLPGEITSPNNGSFEGEGKSGEGEFVAIRLSSSGLSNDGLFTAANDAWALYRDDEGVLEELQVKFPPIPNAAAAASVDVAGENEDEEKKETEGELIRITRGEEGGWTNFLVEVNRWKGWGKEVAKQKDGSLETGQLHVKVHAF